MQAKVDLFERLRRVLEVFRPSHRHTALSATLLLMFTVMLSRVIGYFREAYIAYAFGAGPQTDAYVAAYSLPDMLCYVLAAGSISITFTSTFSRYIAEGRKDEALEGFSTILTTMLIVLGTGITLSWIYAVPIQQKLFPRFTPEQIQACAEMSRILLPGKLFMYTGSIMGAVLLSRRQFALPAFAPLIYSGCIIVAGVLLSNTVGMKALAIGALCGSFFGLFLLNAIGAYRAGIRYKPSLNFRNRAFREWVKLSIPLMVGVSIVASDNWILRYYASGDPGQISRLHYAKRLFNVPLALLAQTAGQASLPFFARLFGEGDRKSFESAVAGTISRIAQFSLLATAWMVPAALPIVCLMYRRGRFDLADAHQTAFYLLLFSIALVFWALQVMYARAFYAAGNSWTPMWTQTGVTVIAFVLYGAMYRTYSIRGLAAASGIAMAIDAVLLALLLHRKSLVRLSALQWREIGKVSIIASASFIAGWVASTLLKPDGGRLRDILSLAAITFAWGAVAYVGLAVSQARLLFYFKKRFGSMTLYLNRPAPVAGD